MTQDQLNNHPLYLAGIPEQHLAMWDERIEALAKANGKTIEAMQHVVISATKAGAAIRLTPDPIVEAMRKEVASKDWSVRRSPYTHISTPYAREIIDAVDSCEKPYRKIVIRKGVSVGMSSAILPSMVRWLSDLHPYNNCTDNFMRQYARK